MKIIISDCIITMSVVILDFHFRFSVFTTGLRMFILENISILIHTTWPHFKFSKFKWFQNEKKINAYDVLGRNY